MYTEIACFHAKNKPIIEMSLLINFDEQIEYPESPEHTLLFCDDFDDFDDDWGDDFDDLTNDFNEEANGDPDEDDDEDDDDNDDPDDLDHELNPPWHYEPPSI